MAGKAKAAAKAVKRKAAVKAVKTSKAIKATKATKPRKASKPRGAIKATKRRSTQAVVAKIAKGEPRVHEPARATFSLAPKRAEAFLAAMAEAASRDPLRPPLTAINFRWAEGTLIAEATDSYVLVEVDMTAWLADECTTNGEGSFAITGTAIATARALAKSATTAAPRGARRALRNLGTPTPQLVFEFGDRASVRLNETQLALDRPEWQFPDTGRLWVSVEGPPIPGTLWFNASTLARLTKMIGATGVDAEHRTVSIEPYGEVKAAKWTAKGLPIRGLIMPVRSV